LVRKYITARRNRFRPYLSVRMNAVISETSMLGLGMQIREIPQRKFISAGCQT